MENKKSKKEFSKLRASGSKRRLLSNGNYADGRHRKKASEEVAPFREKMKKTAGTERFNLAPLIRKVASKTGKSWDLVYAELVHEIPEKFFEFREIIHHLVKTNTVMVDGKPVNLINEKSTWFFEAKFYVDENGILQKVPEKPSRHPSKQLKKEL